MSKVVLRILLKGGGFIQVVLADEDSKKIIGGWLSGALPTMLGGPDWAVKVDCIQGMHLVPVEQSQAPSVGRMWPGSSGVN